MKTKKVWMKTLAILLVFATMLPWIQQPVRVTADDRVTITQPTDAPTGTDALPPEMVPADETKPQGDPPPPQPNEGNRESSVFDFKTVTGGVKIIGWHEVFNGPGEHELIIPDVYVDPGSGEEQPVVAIGSMVFENKEIKKLTIGAHVVEIEAKAFSNNLISDITFADAPTGEANALAIIGADAFLNNEFQVLNLPPNIVTIGNNAFSRAFSLNHSNTLTMGDKVQTIGNNAFDKNRLIAVTLPDSITQFGTNVFVDNARFVAVTTNSPSVPKIEKLVTADGRNRFGHVVNPIVVIIECVDERTGDVLRSDVEGDDLTKDNVFAKGETVTYNTRTIPGYYAEPVIELTPMENEETIQVMYRSTNESPTITVVSSPVLELNMSDEAVDAKLKTFVRATDLTGVDITDDIVIDKGDLNTAVPGTYSVIYRVTDRFGNHAEKSVSVAVADDWETYPIGNGWVMGDFTYSGTTLMGFSQQGLERYKTNKDLVLPGFVLTGSAGNRQPGDPIQSIAASAFKDKKLDSVDFSLCESLERINTNAFRNTSVPAVNFNQLPALKRIESYAFRETSINQLDFSGAKNLEYIGYEAFASVKGGITALNFGSLPKLKEIGSYALSTVNGSSQMRFSDKIDLTGLTGLETIGSYNFNYVPATEIDLTGLTKLGRSDPMRSVRTRV